MPVAGGWGTIGEETKVLSAAECCLRHEAKGLACVDAFAKRNFLGAFDDTVCDPVEKFSALARGEITPSRKGTLRCFGSIIDIVPAASRDIAEMPVVDRRTIAEGPARPCNDGLATDLIQNRTPSETLEVTRCRLDIVLQIGHRSATSEVITNSAVLWAQTRVDVAHFHRKGDRVAIEC